MKQFAIYDVKLVRETNKRYDIETNVIDSSIQAGKIVQTVLDLNNATVEKFGMLCLDNKNKVVGVHILGIGIVNQCLVDIKGIFQRALLNNAVKIVTFHNHPAGGKESNNDLDVHKKILSACKVMEIELLDNIILQGENKYISFAEKGLM